MSAYFSAGGAGFSRSSSRAVFQESTRASRTIASKGPRECIYTILLSFETVPVRFVSK